MSDASGEPPAAMPWSDLASNQPGQAGRERAAALYSQWRQNPLLRRLASSRSEEQEARRTVAGQVFVARQLARLGDSWHVLHTIPEMQDQAAIDHLLVGPGGVFAINSRLQADKTVWLGGDTLMANGERINPVRDSLADAERASELLSIAVGFEVRVTGLVIIVGDNRFDVRCRQRDSSVHVTTPRPVVRWLRHRPVEWTDFGIERIYNAARRSTTWTATPAEPALTEPAEPRVLDVPVSHQHRAAS
jgi:hypothetical protein